MRTTAFLAPLAAVAAVAALAAARPAPLAAQDARPTFVIIGMGDSYASGEGAPEVHGSYAPDGQLGNTVERWTDTADAAAFNDAWRCHRSPRAAFPIAVDSLRQRYPGIRFVFASFACSGARADSGIIGPYRGAENHFADSPLLAPQIDQAAAFLTTLPERRLDAILMNIGGNDAGFGGIIGDCLLVPDVPAVPDDIGCESNPITQGRIADGLAALGGPNGRYATMNTLFNQRLQPAEVYLTEVPNPARGSDGRICHRQPPLDLLLRGATRTEGRFIEEQVVGGLNQAFRTAAAGMQPRPWRIVGGIAAAFRLHGICAGDSWFRDNGTAIAIQGPDVGAFTATTPGGVRVEVGLISSGFLHPNPAGYRAIARRIIPAIDSQVQRRFTITAAPRLALDTATPPADLAGLRRSATPVRNTRLARATGTFTFSWTDPAPDETVHFVLTVAGRSTELPAGTTRHQVHADGRVAATVRACSPLGCGPESPALVASNVLPGAPDDLRRVTSPQGNQWAGMITLSWTAADANHEYFEVSYRPAAARAAVSTGAASTGARAERTRAATRSAALPGRPSTTRAAVQRVTDTRATLGSRTSRLDADAQYEVTVRACSAAGCSEPAALTVGGMLAPATRPAADR